MVLVVRTGVRVRVRGQASEPHGPQFAAVVKHMLEREVNWMCWKRDKCPAFERQSAGGDDDDGDARDGAAAAAPMRKRVKRPAAGGAAPVPIRVRVGNDVLDRLWSLSEDNVSCLEGAARGHVPTLREFLEPLIEQMEPDSGVEAEYLMSKDKIYCWKALRILTRNNVGLLTKYAGDIPRGTPRASFCSVLCSGCRPWGLKRSPRDDPVPFAGTPTRAWRPWCRG